MDRDTESPAGVVIASDNSPEKQLRWVSAARERASAFVLLALALLVTASSYHFMKRIGAQQVEQAFSALIREISSDIDDSMAGFEDALRASRALILASEHIDRRGWLIFQATQRRTDHPGTLGIGFAPEVRPADLQKYVRSVRESEAADYRVWPATTGPPYAPVRFSASHNRDTRALGLNLYSEPKRKAAMERARDTGMPTLSAVVTLVKADDKPAMQSIILYLPVYNGELAPTASVSQRRAALASYVYCPIIIGQFMADVAEKTLSKNVSVKITDDAGITLFASSSHEPATREALAVTEKREIFGQPWTLRYAALPTFAGMVGANKAAYVGVSGAVISLLLFGIVWASTSTRLRAQALARDMTKDLRESEERFRGLTQLSTDWFWEQDEHFRFVSQSGGGLTSMNITPERMMGKTRWELDFVGVTEAAWAEHKAILEAHLQFHDLELGRQNDNGETRYITISGEPVFNEAGKFKGYRGVGRDTTARKQVEQALQASEESHRLLAENSSDMILRITPQGTLTYVSPASLATLGYKSEELVGSRLPGFIHPDDREEAQRLYDEVVRDNLVKVVTCRLRRQDGTWTWTETSFRPVRDENTQRTVLVIGVSRNVEERVRVTAALNRFKDVLDHTLDMILMYDAETLRFSYVNQGTAKALGYSRDEMLRMSPWHVRTDVTESVYRRSIEPFLQGNVDLRQFESVYRRSDGSEFPVDVTMQIVRRPHELPMFISVARDASERKKLDRMKNEFVSTVSHELRTPLTSIRGSLGLIAGGAAGELPAQAKKLVAIAYNNSERLVRLINDILDMEKIESGNMRFDLQPHRLRLLLEQAVEATRAYGEQLRVGFKILGEIPDRTILADSDRFMQVMANLLSNAAKFSPSPGVVEVTAHRTGAALRICVTDQGPGIPLDFRDKIFGKFSQADSTDSRQKGGTGLGLSIIKAIVEKHGGEVGFDSEIGSGTTFYVSFPEVREEPSVDAHPNGNTEKCVLVCEDDPETASAIATILATGGFTTQIAPTLSAARALLVDQCYVAVTLDLLLPDGDGIDLIRELRQRPATRTLPIVVVSIDAENGRMRLNESPSQVTAWLDKPLNHRKLLEMVRGGVCGARSGKARILHVEDDADVKQVVSAIAADVADFDFASTVSEASALLGRNTYSLVILDLELQDGSGWKVLTELNGLESPPPVIVFTAQNLDAEQSRSVAATLTKGNTSNQHLLEVIKRVTEIAEKASVA